MNEDELQLLRLILSSNLNLLNHKSFEEVAVSSGGSSAKFVKVKYKIYVSIPSDCTNSLWVVNLGPALRPITLSPLRRPEST